MKCIAGPPCATPHHAIPRATPCTLPPSPPPSLAHRRFAIDSLSSSMCLCARACHTGDLLGDTMPSSVLPTKKTWVPSPILACSLLRTTRERLRSFVYLCLVSPLPVCLAPEAAAGGEELSGQRFHPGVMLAPLGYPPQTTSSVMPVVR